MLCINNFSGSSPIQLQRESTESLENTHQRQCCLQLNLTHESVDIRPNKYGTTRTSASSSLKPHQLTPQNKPLTGKESGVCSHAGQQQQQQQLVRPSALSEPSVPACGSLGTAERKSGRFCIGASCVVADVAAHYGFRTHPCAAVATEPPAGAQHLCRAVFISGCGGVFMRQTLKTASNPF